MKKISIIFGIVILIGFSVLVICKNVSCDGNNYNDNYLRIHIRANSNSDKDQGIKFAVKESVVKYLSPYLSKVNSVESAMEIIDSKLKDIEIIANQVLYKNGFNYKSRARLAREEFPTRTYESLTLEEGIYDALIIELGQGVGNNWWCVVYPPLCFVSKEEAGDSVKYKSLIYEIVTREE